MRKRKQLHRLCKKVQKLLKKLIWKVGLSVAVRSMSTVILNGGLVFIKGDIWWMLIIIALHIMVLLYDSNFKLTDKETRTLKALGGKVHVEASKGNLTCVVSGHRIELKISKS